MWELGAAAAAIAALLVPAAPGPDLPPPLPPPGPDGCVVPLDTVLDPCAPEEEVRPPVLCVVPVTRFVPPTLQPDCPDPVPDPRGRFVPVTP